MHNIGHFIDYVILQIVQRQITCTRDTKQFIQKIKRLQLLNDVFQVAFDASNMYKNLESDEILDATKRALQNINATQYTIPIPSSVIVLNLLKFNLENNEFTFNNKIYRQKIGVPMGG